MIKHFEIRIFGRVQGVGFRFAAVKKARSLNLKGWVENLQDGSVLAAVQGENRACGEFILWCRNGTGYSWVERISISEKEPASFKAFAIRR